MGEAAVLRMWLVGALVALAAGLAVLKAAWRAML